MTVRHRPKTPVAAELWDQWMVLLDPETQWVRRTPRLSFESCLIMAGSMILSVEARYYLGCAINAEGGSTPADWGWAQRSAYWNDHQAKNREQVCHVLETAMELAAEDGK